MIICNNCVWVREKKAKAKVNSACEQVGGVPSKIININAYQLHIHSQTKSDYFLLALIKSYRKHWNNKNKLQAQIINYEYF